MEYTDERGQRYQFVVELPQPHTTVLSPEPFFVYLSPVALREAEGRTGRTAVRATDAENTTPDGKTLRVIGHERIKAVRVGYQWTI